MKRLITVILSLLFSHVAYAVPARSVPFVAIQPDGTEITLTLVGDEKFHYYLTEDGVPVLQTGEESRISYYYATIREDALIPSSMMAHSKEKRTTDEKHFIASQTESVLEYIKRKKTAIRQEARSMSAQMGDNPLGNVKYTGKKRGLVILVNFADAVMYGANPRERVNRQFNEIGYSDNGHIGSVHDYFYDQSYGQFDLTFDIVGPVSVSHEVSYYGQNDYGTGRNDIRIGGLVTEACRQADFEIDYSRYDWNGDGEVEQVFIIYAGYGEASGGYAHTIWPHKYSLSNCKYWGDGEGPLNLDGVKIDTYACSCELTGSSGKTYSGIGTACHEFSHCLGLPDLYDVDYTGAFGMNKWDIMDSGSYSGPNAIGEVPYGYSAYEKACAGWMELAEIEEEDNYILPPVNDFPVAYRIINYGNTNEFFVLENHQSSGWYSYIGSHKAPHGMMITHIDYNAQSWNNNIVNTYRNHMRESIIPADKNYGTFISESRNYKVTEDDFAGDLFPGKKNAVRFSSKSYYECGGKLFNENIDGSFDLNMTIDNIMEENGIISFTAGENLEIPKNIAATQTSDGRVRIQWDAVDNAKEYSVEILNIASIQPIIIERREIEGIYDTSASVENLNYKRLSIRIKAKNEYVSSEWSDYISTDINTNGIIDTESENSQHGEFYTVSGSRIKMPIEQGIYIINENNRKKKIFIRQ